VSVPKATRFGNGADVHGQRAFTNTKRQRPPMNRQTLHGGSVQRVFVAMASICYAVPADNCAPKLQIAI
jgi:hypothetical protein